MNRLLLFAAAASLVALAGCSTLSKLQDYTVSQSTVDTVMASYDSAFLAPAKNYADLARSNPCSVGVTNANGACGQPNVARKLQDTDKVVETALSALQAQLDACKAVGQDTCAGAGALYSTLKTAISAAEQMATTYGVI